MNIVKEYVSVVLSELKVNRNFLKRIRKGMSTNSANSVDSESSKTIALKWINKFESYSENDLPANVKQQVIKFAMDILPRLVRKNDDNGSLAAKELTSLLDMKFNSINIK